MNRLLPAQSRLLLLTLVFGCCLSNVALTAAARPTAYLVQAPSASAAAAAVEAAGGVVTRRLAIVNGVSANLSPAAAARLARDARLALHADGPVYATGGGDSSKETDTAGALLYPSAATNARTLHPIKLPGPKTACANKRVTVSTTREDRPLQGWGVTVAVIDSGFMPMEKADTWKRLDATTRALYAEKDGRCIVYRDFLPQSAANNNAGALAANSADQSGHGTHVISTIADNRKAVLPEPPPVIPGLPPPPVPDTAPVGVAPQVNLMVARALGADGSGTYGDVIAAIEWVISQKATFNVRVLNLSLYAPVSGPYWADPMNQAVMKAWQAGIVVVAAAGNAGDTPGSITVPGNVPYVITVGAVKSGRYTDSGFDELAGYSSRGPTESAFVKPDVLVPASRTIAPMPDDSTLALLFAAGSVQQKIRVDYKIGAPSKSSTYYRMSGTSMAAAQVSGILALMLQANPTLTNNQAKYRLMATARPAVDAASNQPIYTPWEQGSGLVDTPFAVFAPLSGAANEGMDINQDLNTTTHYWGYTTWDQASGQFQLADPATGQQAAVWSGGRSIWGGGRSIWGGGAEHLGRRPEHLGRRQPRLGGRHKHLGQQRIVLGWREPGVGGLTHGARAFNRVARRSVAQRISYKYSPITSALRRSTASPGRFLAAQIRLEKPLIFACHLIVHVGKKPPQPGRAPHLGHDL